MKKRRGKLPRNKKYVSLMLVPHNSDKVKTWKISHIHAKFFSILAFFMLVIIALSGYLALVTQENRELRKEHNDLNSFFVEQQEMVMQNISVITDIEDLDNVSREKLEEFTYQVQDLTENYINKEIKTLTVSRSSLSSNSTISFVSKVAELRGLLSFLEEADKQEDGLFSELNEKKEELSSYLDHLPTFWPTKGIIESGFGNRFHPIYKRFRDHTGVDIGGKTGNSIYAAASGTVVTAGKGGGYGYYVDIDHGNGLVTRYAHCSKLLVRKWQKVKVGDEIAKVGETGIATGPHLHFEILLKGKPIDPVVFIGTKAN